MGTLTLAIAFSIGIETMICVLSPQWRQWAYRSPKANFTASLVIAGSINAFFIFISIAIGGGVAAVAQIMGACLAIPASAYIMMPLYSVMRWYDENRGIVMRTRIQFREAVASAKASALVAYNAVAVLVRSVVTIIRILTWPIRALSSRV